MIEHVLSITDKNHQPSLEEISEYIGNPLFDKLCGHMQAEFGASADTAYSRDVILPGWNVRFHRSGKTLCRLYPKSGFFSVLVVVGKKEKERVEALLPEMSARLQRVYSNTPEGMGQRWLIMDFDRHDTAYDDLLRIIRIRMGK